MTNQHQQDNKFLSGKKLLQGNKQNIKSHFLCTVALCTLLTPTHLTAKEADVKSAIFDELVVTASKRGAQSLQKVPAAIQVIGGTQLMKEGLLSLDSLVSKVPGLYLESYGPGDSEYIIRGINASGEATVGVYYDESVITGRFEQDGGGKSSDIRLYDIKRIEVLKGPQGTLYGANSMAGTVKLITNKPDLSEVGGTVGGSIGTTKESDDINYEVYGVLNLPIVKDILGIRVVAWNAFDAGWVDNVVYGEKDQNNNDVQGGRIHLMFQPNDNFYALLTYTHQERTSDGDSRVTPEGRTGAGDLAEGITPFAGGKFINTEHSRTPWNENLDLVSLTLEQTFEAGTLTGTVSHYNRDIVYHQDSTPINLASLSGFFKGLHGFAQVPASVVRDPQTRKFTTGEIRFASTFDGPLNFIAGAYASREDSEFNLGVINVGEDGYPLDQELVLAAPIGGNSVFGRFLNGERTKKAVFAEVTWDINDALALTAGGRYFKFDITEDQGNTTPVSLAGGNALTLKSDENKFTYKVNLAYIPGENTTYYAQVSTGFRPGGTNVGSGVAAITGATDIPESFESDELTNYEVGAKFKLFDDRLRLELAAYLIEWDNIQVQSQTNGFIFLDNAGAAQVKGFEVFGSADLSSGFSTTFGISLIDAKFTEDQPFLNPDISFTAQDGDRIPKTPKFTLNLGGKYEYNLSNGMTVSFLADLFYKSSSYSSSNAFDAVSKTVVNPDYYEVPSYVKVNLNATLEADKWTATLFADNLFNEYYIIDAISAEPQDPLTYITGRPRTFGIRVNYNF